MVDFVLWGTSGHALVLADLIGNQGYRLIAFFDNDPETVSPYADIPVFHGAAGFRAWRSSINKTELPFAAVAIGGTRGKDRCEIARVLQHAGLQLPALVHSRAIVASDLVVEEGGQVLAGAVIGPRVNLGMCTIVNSNANVDHECNLDDGVHIAPGATLCGCIAVGQNSLIGPGAVVVPRVKIGRNAVIGAGSVVTRDIPDGVVVWGTPARIIREKIDG